jgi:NAD(P)H dehydrogenase (quinone)
VSRASPGGATVELKRVPETVPEHIARPAHFKLDQQAPIATVDELPDYDAIIIGAPTRYGRMPSQMPAFLDQTATQHGGQETTLFPIITNLLHLGVVAVGLPYSLAGQTVRLRAAPRPGAGLKLLGFSRAMA